MELTGAERARLGEALLDSASDAVVVAGRDGRIRFWNRGAERIFGWPADAALGRSLDIIIPENLRARHWQGFDQVMSTGESRYGEGDLLSVPALRRDGTRISVEFMILPLAGADGRIDALAAVMRDVTARFEEMKALRRRLREAGPG